MLILRNYFQTGAAVKHFKVWIPCTPSPLCRANNHQDDVTQKTTLWPVAFISAEDSHFRPEKE